MKTEKIIWGLILIFIGGVFLLENFNVIDFYWSSLLRFWPLILIVVGVNMLFSRSDFAAGPYFSVVITILVLSFIGYMGVMRPGNTHWLSYNFKFDRNFNYNDGNSGNAGRKRNSRMLAESWGSQVKEANLSIRGGAAAFSIKDTTSELIDAAVQSSGADYTITRHNTNDTLESVDLNLNSKNRKFHLNDIDGSSAAIRLNARPRWNIDVNVGAGESTFDLTPFNVKRLSFKGGAAAFKAKLGVPESVTNVSVNTGVSKVELAIPASAGCKISVKSGLSSRDFPGFEKHSDGSFTTDNYAGNAKKIIVNLKGGLSDFEVRRYK
jgi:hypothetical protein